MTQFKEEDLTRFVLGEMSAEEKANVENELRTNSQLQAEVKKLRVFTEAFSKEIKKESLPSLETEQRAAIEKKISKKLYRNKFTFWAAPLGLAFGFMAVIVFNRIQKGEADRLAITSPKTEELVANQPEVGKDNSAQKLGDLGQETSTMEEADSEDRAMDAPIALKAPQKQARAAGQLSSAGAPATPPSEKWGGDAGAGGPAIAPSPTVTSQLSVSGSAPGYAHVEGASRSRLFKKSKADQLKESEIGADKFNTESYAQIVENNFKKVGDEPYSTFSIDVDTAGYSVMRRFLMGNGLPPADSVRIEELLNYFPYDYRGPTGSDPFAVNMELTKAPWNDQHKLLRVGLKAKDIDWKKKPSSNLVFLLDVSGSMEEPNKLPLVKASLKMLVENLGEKDKVAIVVYAGASGLALPATRASDHSKIVAALDNLMVGGSTNGGDGIRLAYKTAQENFIPGGINRVILATDGDFNVGTTSEADLVNLITEKAKSKVFLTVLGFGMGNYKDQNLEKLANKGNGAYAYIDTANEARKVMVEQAGGTLMTVAKDVKIQIEFNPSKVAGYRLIGYENRLLNKEDFNDDTKDAGEIGAGHTVTALYEIVPAGQTVPGMNVDPLRYRAQPKVNPDTNAKELLNFKLRYKKPEADVSQLITVPVMDTDQNFSQASSDLKFQAAVAEFGMILRDSKFKGSASWGDVIEKVQGNLNRAGKVDTYRAEFLELVKKAKVLKK